jgi:hypothetical protein
MGPKSGQRAGRCLRVSACQQTAVGFWAPRRRVDSQRVGLLSIGTHDREATPPNFQPVDLRTVTILTWMSGGATPEQYTAILDEIDADWGDGALAEIFFGSVADLPSRTVRDVSAGSGLAFESLGPQHLKGVPEDIEVFRVRAN